MSGNGKQHPGRSTDFLSRLHDGDLEPGERAHFESHRAHCAECRRAAVEFEDALALFRSARSRPPQPDLAGRILRKIQTSSPRPRAPFGRRFRMDLGLAAMLLTGIFALLLSVRRPEAPIVVSFPAPAPDPGAVAPGEPAAVPGAAADEDRESVQRNRPVAAAPKPGAAAKDSATARAAEPAAPPPAAAPPPDAPEKEVDSPAAESSRDERRPAPAAESGRAGGTEESVAVAAPASPLRLSIEAIDGYGSAPRLLSDARMVMPASYRGHEFILLVDSQGKVSEVRPGPRRERREEGARLEHAPPAPSALSELHFQPGNRPRRLLVRFE